MWVGGPMCEMSVHAARGWCFNAWGREGIVTVYGGCRDSGDRVEWLKDLCSVVMVGVTSDGCGGGGYVRRGWILVSVCRGSYEVWVPMFWFGLPRELGQKLLGWKCRMEVGFGKVGISKVGLGKVGIGKVGFGEVGFGEVGFSEVRFGKLGGHLLNIF